MFLGVAGAADSAGPGRGQGVASHSHRPAAATDCQVRCLWWTRQAHTAGNRGFSMASNTSTILNPCICRSSHTRSQVLPVSGITARQGQETIQVPIWDLHLSYTRHPATNTSESCPHYLISGCGGSPRLCPR